MASSWPHSLTCPIQYLGPYMIRACPLDSEDAQWLRLRSMMAIDPNNLHIALPLLDPYRPPATVFIATARLDRHQPFWWGSLSFWWDWLSEVVG
jgi:hypothetical protein